MKTPFFGQYGYEVEFQNESELLGKLSNIDCSVPARTQGRKSGHRERCCLKTYLMQLSQNGFLKFPLKIIKEEAPDFLILCHDETTALEVTDASTEDYQRAMTELEESPQGTVLESGTNKLVKPGERLIGEGWSGNSVETEWVDIILNSIIDKTTSLNQPHFKPADRYELLIYDNSPLSVMLQVKDALPLLRKAIHEKLNAKFFEKNFHCISVIHSNQLLYDIGNKVMFEDYISEKEISHPRMTKEFINWFEEKLKILKEYRGELKKQILLHEGFAKIFYEELFPLYRFLQHKEKEWHDVKVMCILGNQNFDVKLGSKRKDIPQYIEITQADLNEEEHLRMRYFCESSSVSMIGEVSHEGTKRTGLRISVEDGFRKESELNVKKKDQIETAIKNKQRVAKRPDGTALLVYFDDYVAFSHDQDRKELSEFLDSTYNLWKDQYTNFFVVGASGRYFCAL